MYLTACVITANGTSIGAAADWLHLQNAHEKGDHTNCQLPNGQCPFDAFSQVVQGSWRNELSPRVTRLCSLEKDRPGANWNVSPNHRRSWLGNINRTTPRYLAPRHTRQQSTPPVQCTGCSALYSRQCALVDAPTNNKNTSNKPLNLTLKKKINSALETRERDRYGLESLSQVQLPGCDWSRHENAVSTCTLSGSVCFGPSGNFTVELDSRMLANRLLVMESVGKQVYTLQSKSHQSINWSLSLVAVPLPVQCFSPLMTTLLPMIEFIHFCHLA